MINTTPSIKSYISKAKAPKTIIILIKSIIITWIRKTWPTTQTCPFWIICRRNLSLQLTAVVYYHVAVSKYLRWSCKARWCRFLPRFICLRIFSGHRIGTSNNSCTSKWYHHIIKAMEITSTRITIMQQYSTKMTKTRICPKTNAKIVTKTNKDSAMNIIIDINREENNWCKINRSTKYSQPIRGRKTSSTLRQFWLNLAVKCAKYKSKSRGTTGKYKSNRLRYSLCLVISSNKNDRRKSKKVTTRIKDKLQQAYWIRNLLKVHLCKASTK